jgi:DNA repair protein RadC
VTPQLKKPEDVVRVMKDATNRDRECFWVLHVDVKLRLLHKEMVAMGTLNCAIVDPRSVFRKAVIRNTNAILLVHNHPSGDPDPSDEDLAVTKQLIQAGDILGIKVVDHIVLGADGSWKSCMD